MLACFPTRSARRNTLSEKNSHRRVCSGRTISQWLTLRTGGRLHAVRPLEYIGCRLVAGSCLAWTRLALLRMDMASTVIWFPVGLFRIYCVDLKNQFCYAVGSWRHLGSHGIWGHMAVFTSFRKGMPSLTAFSRARWCLDGERFECQQNFHATQNVCRFFFNGPGVLPCLCLYARKRPSLLPLWSPWCSSTELLRMY